MSKTRDWTPTNPKDEAAWKEMWQRKDDGCEMFAQATLTRDVEFRTWHGNDLKEPRVMKAGERVLITLRSRLGHVCIRGYDIDEQKHGYDTGVHPDDLTDIKFLAPAGKGWRQELRERIEKSRKENRGPEGS